MSGTMLKSYMLLAIASVVAGARSLSQFSVVNNQGSGDFNISVIDPSNQGLTDELGNQTFFASPGLGFANAFLLTGVTTQAEDSFNQVTSGEQNLRVGSGVSIFEAASQGFARGAAELTNDNSFANITQFTRQDSSAEANNNTVGNSISRGQFASYTLLRDGSGLSTAEGSESGVELQVTGFSIASDAVVDGSTTVVGPTARTIQQGETGAVVNPTLIANECQGSSIGQVVNGQISQGSNCILSVTFGA